MWNETFICPETFVCEKIVFCFIGSHIEIRKLHFVYLVFFFSMHINHHHILSSNHSLAICSPMVNGTFFLVFFWTFENSQLKSVKFEIKHKFLWCFPLEHRINAILCVYALSKIRISNFCQNSNVIKYTHFMR